jgi:hypothetical protein
MDMSHHSMYRLLAERSNQSLIQSTSIYTVENEATTRTRHQFHRVLLHMDLISIHSVPISVTVKTAGPLEIAVVLVTTEHVI